jgi:hypothetical protein
VFVTLLLPLPRLGLTPDIVASAGLVGSGYWIENPHSVVAFGLIYFGLQALAKGKDWLHPR